jgi:hypothetical protein
MKSQEFYRGLRKVSVCDVVNAPRREHRRLGVLHVNGAEMPIEQRRMVLAMSRDPRRNAMQSARLAMQIARGNSDVSVVYFNSYAGRELMRECFGPENTTPQPPPLSEEGEYDCTQLENLHIIDVPFGEWDLGEIIQTLRPQSWEPSPLDKPLVIILNDFELSGFTAWNRRCVARDLIRLKEQVGATVVVFSHEMREDLEAGMPGRGALGLLAIRSEAVHRMLGEFDHLVKVRKEAETATVHEAQTKDSESDGEFTLIRNSLEGGQDLFELPMVAAGFRLRGGAGSTIREGQCIPNHAA